MRTEPLYQKLFRRYAEGIIYKPAQMQVDQVDQGNGRICLYVDVHPDDIGLLCGTKGRTIKELQFIFRELGRPHGHHVRISVATDESIPKNNRQPSRRFQEIGKWSRSGDAVELLSDTITMLGLPAPATSIKENHDTTLITLTSDVPDDLFQALNGAIHAWGKSLGRHIFLLRPDQIKTESTAP